MDENKLKEIILENEELAELVDEVGIDCIVKVLSKLSDVAINIKDILLNIFDKFAETMQKTNNKFQELFDKADFELQVQYNHLDELLCDIDDQLTQLYIDKICTILDKEIEEELGRKHDLEDELNYIELKIDLMKRRYDVVFDLFDKVFFEILEG